MGLIVFFNLCAVRVKITRCVAMKLKTNGLYAKELEVPYPTGSGADVP